MKLTAIVAAVFLASCASNTAVGPIATPGVPGTTPCTPAPVPAPNVALSNPMPGATGVPTSTASISATTIATITAFEIAPAVNGTSTIANVSPVGSPSPDGTQGYTAPLPAPLTAKTTYTVTADVSYAPGGCPQTSRVTAGSFST